MLGSCWFDFAGSGKPILVGTNDNNMSLVSRAFYEYK